MEKYAYATVATTDMFIPCIIRQQHRMEYLKCKYPFIVLITENISKKNIQLLEKNHINFKIIPYQNYKNVSMKHMGYKPTQTYDFFHQDNIMKFEILQLIEYEQVLFIDADTIFIKNVDFVFNLYKIPKNKHFIFYKCPDKEFGFNSYGIYFFCKPDLSFLTLLKETYIKKYELYKDDEDFVHRFFYNDVKIIKELNNVVMHLTGRPKLWTLQTQSIQYIFFEASKHEFNLIIDKHYENIKHINVLFCKACDEAIRFAGEDLKLLPIQKHHIK